MSEFDWTPFMIAIPTRGRVKDQVTLKSLPPYLRKYTILVCPHDEANGLCQTIKDNKLLQRGDLYPMVVVQPEHIKTIAAKRAWMLEWCHQSGIKKVLMLDDDLFFYYRYWNATARFWKHKEAVGDWRLLDSDADHTLKYISELMRMISPEIPHGGFGPRQGNDKTDGGWLKGGNRLMLALAYHVPTVVENVKFERVKLREDMDIALQLYEKGYPSIFTNDFVVGQKNYAAPGGCSAERTVAISDAEAQALADLHPGLVRVVDRAYKGTPRKEVVVYWKKALMKSGYPNYAAVAKDATNEEGLPISGNRD